MTAELVTTGNKSDLSIVSDQSYWSDKQIAALGQLGMVDRNGNTPPPGDLAVFFHQCARTGLDPFVRQTYMIERYQNGGMKWTIQTGIDGFRLVARRAVDAAHETLGYEDTLWCGEDGVWTDVWLAKVPPAAAKVTVLRNGQRFPGLALFSEYAGTKKDGGLTSMWATKGSLMLAKCAEALALRRAFPHDLSGLYTSDEMSAADNHQSPMQRATQPAQDNVGHAVRIVTEPEGAPETGRRNGDTEAITRPQLAKLSILIKELQMQKEEALGFYLSTTGREVATSKDLTKAEASVVIDALESARTAGADPTTGEVQPEIVDAEVVEDDGWPEVAGVRG